MTAMKRICKNSKIKNQRKQTGLPPGGYAGILMELKQNSEHRLLWMAAGSLCLNLAYVFYNGLLGVTYRSLWFVTLCMYYGVLSCLRLNLVEERDCGWTGGGAVRVLADNPELCVDGRSVFELSPE